MAIDLHDFDQSGRRVTVMTLDRITDLPETLRLRRRNPANQNLDNYTRDLANLDKHNGRSWYGCKTNNGKTEMDGLYANGWEEGAARALELKADVSDAMPAPVSRKRRLAWRDDGDELDRDRLMNGNLDTMWRTSVRQFNPNPQNIAIGVEWGGNAGLSSEQLFWSGAAAAALADTLEDAGYNVDITAFTTSNSWGTDHRGRQGTFIGVLPVHRAGDPLALSDLAATLCHSGSFRVYGIPAFELMEATLSSGHGCMVTVDPYLTRLEAEGWAPKVDTVIRHVYDRETARTFVRKALVDLAGGDPNAVK